MDALIFAGIVVVAVVLGVVAQRLGWIDLSDKNARRGGGTSPLTIGDEVFNPTRHEAAQEIERQTSMPAPAPAPGDKPFRASDNETGDYRGLITIDLERRSRD